MEIKKAESIPRKYKNDIAGIVNKFVESDMDIAEVVWDREYANAMSCASAVARKISRMCLDNIVGAVRRGESVYLYRVGKVEVDE